MDQPTTKSFPSRQSQEPVIACDGQEYPSFVESELERLYGHIYSSLAYFKLFKPADGASTYVARKAGRVSAVFLFRRDNRTIEVFNEMIGIDAEELRRFAEYAFARFPSVSAIIFPSVRASARQLPFPFQQHDEKEEFVISLPATAEEYTARLGKSTRSNIKRYSKKLQHDFPSFIHRNYEKEEVNEQHVRDIIAMSKARMTDKKKKFSVDDSMAESLVRLAKTCGFVNVIMVDGRLCAGNISYRVGSRYFAFVNAHDPAFDSYWLGTLCYYLTICECIERGATHLHMGWGRYDYKSRLLGVQQDFDRIVIYRSYPRMLLNVDIVVKTFFRARLRRLKVWLQDPQRQNSFISRSAVNAIYWLRKLRGG